MPDKRDSLSPPERPQVEDAGAHELDSESEDQFSDARSVAAGSSPNSPIPRTRVEKVSNEPSYGEVPGTEAYKKHQSDAAPDEIAVVPDSNASAAASASPTSLLPERPSTPGGKPIPTTVVDESADGDGAKTPDNTKHASDPPPDLVVKADGTLEGGACATAPTSIPPPVLNSMEGPPSAELQSESTTVEATEEVYDETRDGADAQDDHDDADFGDDFDDFEEGGEGGDDDEFGDFDDASTPSPVTQPQHPSAAPQPPPPLKLPILDFDDLNGEEIIDATDPYLDSLYHYQPTEEEAARLHASPPPPPSAPSNPLFLTPRSASLWSQLVAPPPLQPPDWIRSHIRRLFLVSLGVPVDLDEILPASKQKKLVLPSLTLHSSSPRTSTDSRARDREGMAAAANNSVARLKQGANGSSSSVDSQGAPRPGISSRKRRGPPPLPDFDLVTARQLCTTTDEALDGMTDEELRAHVLRLEALDGAAKEALEYWTKRADEKIGDRETFEGVIENLVAHARKTRK